MKRRRRPYRTFATGLITAYVIAVGVYVFGMSLVQSTGERWIQWQDLWVPRLNDVLIVTFFFVVGASVGSFLNVVAWRLPRGGSVNGHSFCPRCRHALRARDNVPVFGWLWLGGRCRDCRLPISPRYPIVEACVGVSYTLVGTAAVLRMNLPYDDFHWHAGPVWIPVVGQGILAILGLHLVGLAIVWAIALIRIDRLSIPTSLTWFAAFVIVATLLVYPPAMIVPWQLTVPEGWPESMSSGSWLDRSVQVAMRCLTSLVTAGFYTRLLSRGLSPGADLKLDPLGSSTQRLLDLAVMLGVVSLLVGWQATVGIVVVASVLARVLPLLFGAEKEWDRLGCFGVAVVIVLTVQLTFWRGLVASGLWPSESVRGGVWMAWLVFSLTIPIWLTEPIQKSPTDVPTH